MPVFESADQLETCARLLFSRVQEEVPLATRQVLGSRLLIRLNCVTPQTEIWINGRRPPLQTSFGAASQRPDLDITLAGDTLHEILMGQLPLRKAMSNGQLKVEGRIWKAQALADLFFYSQEIYPLVLQEQGLAP